MNILDIVILAVLGISLLFGLYRGFISSLLNTGGCLVSLFLSLRLSPMLVDLVRNNEVLTDTLLNYTDAASRIGDLELAVSKVSTLTAEKITEVLNRVSLPAPLDRLLQVNLENQVFAPSNMNEVGSYVSQTIVGACLNVLAWVLCFAAMFLVFSVVINIVRTVFRFPVLKQADSLAGGIFGLLRGLILCYAVFALLPLAETMIPVDQVTELIAGSKLAPYFNNGQLILAIMNGKI